MLLIKQNLSTHFPFNRIPEVRGGRSALDQKAPYFKHVPSDAVSVAISEDSSFSFVLSSKSSSLTPGIAAIHNK